MASYTIRAGRPKEPKCCCCCSMRCGMVASITLFGISAIGHFYHIHCFLSILSGIFMTTATIAGIKSLIEKTKYPAMVCARSLFLYTFLILGMFIASLLRDTCDPTSNIFCDCGESCIFGVIITMIFWISISSFWFRVGHYFEELKHSEELRTSLPAKSKYRRKNTKHDVEENERKAKTHKSDSVRIYV